MDNRTYDVRNPTIYPDYLEVWSLSREEFEALPLAISEEAASHYTNPLDIPRLLPDGRRVSFGGPRPPRTPPEQQMPEYVRDANGNLIGGRSQWSARKRGGIRTEDRDKS